MRTTTHTRIMMLLLSLLTAWSATSQSSFAVETSRTSRIFLEIDAQNLFEDPQLDPKKYCTISDNQGNTPASGEDIRDFTTNVFQGNNVHWWATVDDDSKSLGYSLRLIQIQIKDPKCDIFPRIIIPGNRSDRIFARVNSSADCKTSYVIWFSIEDPEGHTMVFGLDPWVIIRR
ncbi:MAG: hypothetical protein R3356_07035 [Eudoraea sp.]|nr:hypothetical protein [Eudoraea sp.]